MDVSLSLKTCTGCKESKPRESFSKHSRNPDGLNYRCRVCLKSEHARRMSDPVYAEKSKAANKASYWKDIERSKLVRKQWSDANRDRRNEIRRTWRANNKEKVAVYVKTYLDGGGSEKKKEYMREYREMNKEKRTEYNQAWRLRNPEKYKAAQARSRSNRKAKRAACQNNRRASKILRTPGWLTKDDITSMQNMHILAENLTAETGLLHHVDHILPLRGKYVSGLHVPDNLQVIPAADNLRKNNKWVPE